MGLKRKVWSLDCPTRWGSTYKLLSDAIRYPDVLTPLYNETRTNPYQLITDAHWNIALLIRDVLSTFDGATKTFSYVYEPNIHLVIVECIKVVNSINQSLDEPQIEPVLSSMKSKWFAYFTEFPYIYGVATLLDPGVKDEGLKSLLVYYYHCLGINYDVDTYVLTCKQHLEQLYDYYASTYQPELLASSSSKPTSIFDPVISNILKKTKYSSSSSVDDYLSYQFETGADFHIIKWWQKQEYKFPLLARIAKDVLSIPASTIASESAFSAGRRVLDEKRSRLSPQSIEMCVCKKDWDQAERRTQGLREDEEDEDDPWMLFDTDSSTSEKDE